MALGTGGGRGDNCPPPNILPTQKIEILEIVRYK